MLFAPNIFNAELHISTLDAIYFFFFGKPAFIFAYDFGLIVDLDFDLDVPAFFLLLIFPYKLFLVIVSPIKKKGDSKIPP